MYSGGELYGFGGVALVWLLLLTYLYWKERGYLRRLFPKDEEKDIRHKLSEITELVHDFAQERQILAKNFQEFKDKSLGFVKRIEIMRYNPYGDTGGDQSFTIVFLDGKQTGFLLTSLHSRAGTRVYTKEIKKGESDLELSKEERVVLKRAIQEND